MGASAASQLHTVYSSPNRIGPDSAGVVAPIVHPSSKTNHVIKASYRCIILQSYFQRDTVARLDFNRTIRPLPLGV